MEVIGSHSAGEPLLSNLDASVTEVWNCAWHRRRPTPHSPHTGPDLHAHGSISSEIPLLSLTRLKQGPYGYSPCLWGPWRSLRRRYFPTVWSRYQTPPFPPLGAVCSLTHSPGTFTDSSDEEQRWKRELFVFEAAIATNTRNVSGILRGNASKCLLRVFAVAVRYVVHIGTGRFFPSPQIRLSMS